MATDFDEVGNRQRDVRRAAPSRTRDTERNELDLLIEAEIAAINESSRSPEAPPTDGSSVGVADAAGDMDQSAVNFVARASAWLKLRPNRIRILEAVCRQVLGDPSFTLVAEMPAAAGKTDMDQPIAKDGDRL